MAASGAATHTDFPVVVVGSSAGGLEALTRLVSDLPVDFGAAVIIVQHLAPGFKSRMAELLCRHAQLNVKQAEDGEVLHAGVVYIAPPDRHVLVTAERRLALSQAEKVHFLRPSVDMLFSSAGRHAGASVIGVILSGTGSDGTAGLLDIKRAGGTVIAQDELTAGHFGMPGAAIRTGWVDMVLPLGEIAPALSRLVNMSCTPGGLAAGREAGGGRSGPGE